MTPWTADTGHFTADDGTHHTADGWHDHDEESKGDYSGSQINFKVVQADDELLLKAIRAFVEMES